MADESFWDKLVDFLKKAWDWITDEATQENLKALIQIILIIVQTLPKVNDPIPNDAKREKARTILDFLKYVDPEDMAKLAELHKGSKIRDIKSYQMDALLGCVISEYVRVAVPEEPERKGPTKQIKFQ